MSVEYQQGHLTKDEVEARTILRIEVGSTVHGLGVEGTDDRDELGVFIEPPQYVIGLKHYEQLVHRDQPQGVRSQPGDLDLTIYTLRKFCSLALKGNPSILLLFNVPPQACITLTNPGSDLMHMAWAFASRKAGAAFLGYMQQQRQRLMGERGQMNVKRPELVEKYGYDTKYAGHIIRLGFQGIDYMNTGAFPIPMLEEQRDYILAVRKGEVSEQEVLTRAGELEAELKDAIDCSTLPEQPAYDVINEWLVMTYQDFWEENDPR